jgi:hypothetical protein
MPYGVTFTTDGIWQKVRHALSASYQLTISGVSGETAFNRIGDAAKRTALFAQYSTTRDGSSKNIFSFNLGLNDYSAGTTAALYTTWVTALCSEFKAAFPSDKLTLIGNWYSPDDLGLNAGAATITDYDNILSAASVADPTNVFYKDMKAVCSNPHPGADYFDAKHQNTTGAAKCVSPLVTFYSAI